MMDKLKEELERMKQLDVIDKIDEQTRLGDFLGDRRET